MKKGLVLGKFMPLHKGHTGLINFACNHCDQLYILVCYTDKEPIPGDIRVQWLQHVYGDAPKTRVIPFQYDESVLPNTSVSSEPVAARWAKRLSILFPDVSIIFTSEPYGAFLAAHMNISHIAYDPERNQFPFSATDIRTAPFLHWNNIPEIVQPYFVKKIGLLGSESTGKSILTARLAAHFNTVYVPEMARDIVSQTTICRPEHLKEIAQLHASTILATMPKAHKLMFIDTDINITKSYSRFLFNQELEVEDWIEHANSIDTCFFLETDCEFIQDGTRLTEDERNRLSCFHRQQLDKEGIHYITVHGNWEERFATMADHITKHYFSNDHA